MKFFLFFLLIFGVVAAFGAVIAACIIGAAAIARAFAPAVPAVFVAGVTGVVLSTMPIVAIRFEHRRQARLLAEAARKNTMSNDVIGYAMANDFLQFCRRMALIASVGSVFYVWLKL